MIPLISIALTLISNVTDLAHMFVSDQLDDRPAGVTFYFENRHEEATFAFFDEHGDAQQDVLKEFSHFVRCWRTGRQKAMHPRTVEIVTQIAAHFGVEKIDIVSGYRARPYGAPHSKHFLGRAMDIHVPGVKAKVVAAWVWENFRHVGVGYYPKQDFVHVDSRDMDVRDREPCDPRDVFLREVNLPRSDIRERVHDRDREYSLRESESRTLATVGAFRVVSSRDLSDHNGRQAVGPLKNEPQLTSEPIDNQ